MSYLQLQNVRKGYGIGAARINVLDNVNLSIREGEFVAIVGFSGSGKTTLLSLMAGLALPEVGTLTLAGRPITGPGPERGIMFQTYALLPWLTVFDNVALAVDSVCVGVSSAARRKNTERLIELVGLTKATLKRPGELSGGMRQRVSLARTLAMNPDVLLLDEPLGALDALTRGNLQTELASIWAVEKKTCVLVTNDVDEALLLADRILTLTPGPGSTLGREFLVDLPRPRDRKELNHCPEFRSLRNAVTGYLIELRDQSRQAQAAAVANPPKPHSAPLRPKRGAEATALAASS
ncbi:MAG: nitrate ABC transporter ATP-binding protein [Pirellula sp.]|nr:nitrate ABC transporter ATP-binding protein [Pirellula sp.]